MSDNQKYLKAFESYGKVTLTAKEYLIKLQTSLRHQKFVQLYDQVKNLGGSFLSEGEFGAFVIPIETEKNLMLRNIPLTSLMAGPQIRTDVYEALSYLYDSMKQRGLIYPILVMPSNRFPDKFVVIDGHRRWKAASLLEWPTINALVDTTVRSDLDLYERVFILAFSPDDLSTKSEAGDAHFLYMARFLDKKERRQLFDIFLKFLSKGRKITPVIIKEATKRIGSNRTTFIKTFYNQERGLSEYTTAKILKEIISVKSSSELSVEIEKMKAIIFERVERAHRTIHKNYYY